MIEDFKETIFSMSWDRENIIICVATILSYVGAVLLGYVAKALDSRCIITIRGWLILFIPVNIINLFLMKYHYLLAFFLGLFLSLSFYTVPHYIYGFKITTIYLFEPNDREQNIFMAISMGIEFVYVILMLYYIGVF